MSKSTKSPPLRQVAALCWRRETDGSIRVALVTSRDRRRWILPKGWPIKGLRNFEAAETEAVEEAGVVGAVTRAPIGSYTYRKRLAKKTERVSVEVYGLKVERRLDDWREKGQRDIAWLTAEEAARRATDPAVGDLLREEGRRLAAEADPTDPPLPSAPAQARPSNSAVDR